MTAGRQSTDAAVAGVAPVQARDTAALRTLETAATGAVRAVRYDGPADLPAFNPDDDPADGGGEGAVSDLATVLGYVDARVVDAACRRVHVGRESVADDGTVGDPATRDALLDVLVTLADAAG